MTAGRNVGGPTQSRGGDAVCGPMTSHSAGPAAFMRYLRPPVNCTGDNFTSSGDCVCQWLDFPANIKHEVSQSVRLASA